MAKIILGIGTSHGPMLNTPPEHWGQRVVADKTSSRLYFRGQGYKFEELLEERKGERLEKELTPEKMRERFESCQQAITVLGETLSQVAPDVAVIIGDDQEEVFFSDNMPALSVYCGESVDNVPFSAEESANRPPGISIADWAYVPQETTKVPCEPALAKQIIASLMDEGFDLAVSHRLPPGDYKTHRAPHAYGFVYRRIMNDKLIPNVPVFINTFFPPNQPSLKRCYDFGKAMRRAIETWDSDKTVAVIASGGLTHFVIEEDLDQLVLSAIKRKDEMALTTLPVERFQSGTSEIRNWIATAGAMGGTDLEMQLIAYVPCYRSVAGTGNAMGFAVWR